MLATGTQVQLVGNQWVGYAIALVWLVGVTNAFNLLDNMDGLAATLAAIAFGFFAIDAVTAHSSHLILAFALAGAAACAGFLPFNLRAKGRALVFMGDSGSLTLGFALAALGLAASWRVAGTTVATLVLPILILAVPDPRHRRSSPWCGCSRAGRSTRAAATTPRTGSCATACRSAARCCCWR